VSVAVDIYAGGCGPWVSVEQGIIWLDDILLNQPAQQPSTDSLSTEREIRSRPSGRTA
jgi:hypothetical protein